MHGRIRRVRAVAASTAPILPVLVILIAAYGAECACPSYCPPHIPSNIPPALAGCWPCCGGTQASGSGVVTFTLQVQVEGSGQVVLSPPDKTTYGKDESVWLTAVPAAGWRFAGWRGPVSSGKPEVCLTMDADKSVTAFFEFVGVRSSERAISPARVDPM